MCGNKKKARSRLRHKKRRIKDKGAKRIIFLRKGLTQPREIRPAISRERAANIFQHNCFWRSIFLRKILNEAPERPKAARARAFKSSPHACKG